MVDKIAKWIVILLLGLFIILLLDKSCTRPTETTKIEYIVVKDTVQVPIEVIKTNTIIKYKNSIDTFYIKEKDTVFVHDLPIDYKETTACVENDSTKANIYIAWHGFNSDIDSVGLNYEYLKPEKTIIKKNKPYGLDVTVGPSIFYGVNPQGQMNFGAGIAVTLGFGYRITK